VPEILGSRSMRMRLALLLTALFVSVAALALVGLDLYLTGPGSGPLTGTSTPAVIVADAGQTWWVQLLFTASTLTGSTPEPTVFGVAATDLPLLLFASWLALVPVSVFVAWRLAGRMARPLDLVAEAARAAGPSNLAQRAPVGGRRDELGRLGEAFNELMGRFERHELDRRRLVEDAAHEVRNPLAVMRTSLEVALADTEDPTALRAAAEVSQRAGERIERTIDQLHAELRDHARQTARTAVDLADLARELGRDYEAIASRRGVSIQVAARSGVLVLADRDALKQALANLMANAIRVAPVGSPVVVSAGAASGWVWLGVRDLGPGIAAADQPMVFRHGWRRATREGDDGHGIGLALVRQIAEAHGGSVRLTSAPRAGSSFVIWLPAPDRAADRATPVDVHPDPLWTFPALLEA
jgi:signal transduction histidine kinase